MLDGVYEPTPKNIAVTHQETLLLARLVNDLRELALIEAWQLHLEFEPTDLEVVARLVEEAFRPKARGKEVSLVLDFDASLPTVSAEAQRMRQVIANLVSSARRFTPPGGTIGLVGRADHGVVILRVRDTGAGIPPDDLPHIFDRFYRGDRSRSRHAGASGLGLTIVKQLVEAHGGTIEVESEVGQGTVFIITLPDGAGSAR